MVTVERNHSVLLPDELKPGSIKGLKTTKSRHRKHRSGPGVLFYESNKADFPRIYANFNDIGENIGFWVMKPFLMFFLNIVSVYTVN